MNELNKYYKTIQVGKRQVRLHRFLVEEKIGRKLLRNEIVHHKNGNKWDNRIENLEVVSRSQHILLHPEIMESWKQKGTMQLDIDAIKKMYETLSIRKISQQLKVSEMSIWRRLKDAGVVMRKGQHQTIKS